MLVAYKIPHKSAYKICFKVVRREVPDRAGARDDHAYEDTKSCDTSP